MRRQTYFSLFLILLGLEIGLKPKNANAQEHPRALLDEVVVENISSTGRSFVMDRGHLENYKEGDYAKFFVQWGPVRSPKVFLVAEGELVKSFPKKSYWSIRKVHIPNVIKDKTPILVMSDKLVSSGRPNKVINEHIVFSNREYDDLEDYRNKNKDAVPDRLIQKKTQHGAINQVDMDDTDNYLNKDKTAILETYEYYKEAPSVVKMTGYTENLPDKFYVGNKLVTVGDINKEEDRLLLSSMSVGYENKVNQMKYGVKSFYRNAESIESKNHKLVNSVYESIKEEKKAEGNIDSRALAKVKRDGEAWSQDLNDEALRTYFIKTGMEKEKIRRELAINELDGHEIMFYFSNNMTNNTTNEDPNYQSNGYNIGLVYDFHLSRVKDKYKDWTVQFLLEKGLSNYDLGGINAKGDDTIYGGYLNYYLLNNPLTLNSISAFVGIGLKAGQSVASSASLTKEYSYQLMTLPSLQAMLKYRFRTGSYDEDTANVGLSFNLGANLDFKTLSNNDEVVDNINSKLSYTDLKYTVGLSVFF